MKKLIAVVSVLALTTSLLQGNVYAGDEGWAAAGGFLGGLVVGSAISSSPYHHYYYGSPVVYSYPVYPVYRTYGHRVYYPSRYSACTTYYPYYYYDYGCY